MQKYYLLTIIIIFFFIISKSIYEIHSKQNKKKELEFIHYKSSNLEKEWLNILSIHKIDYSVNYCNLIKPFRKRLENLEIDIEQCKNNKFKICRGDELSSFMYKNKKGALIEEYIEPLFGILRNTFSVCSIGSKGDISSKKYLLPSYYSAMTMPVIYIDAGASTFYKGGGGASQSYFYNYYKNFSSIKYKGWYLWEASKQDMLKIKNEVPKNLKNIYHYYNRPIEIDNKSNNNPLNCIKKYQNRSYIIFKLDVDNPSIEIPIFNYLLYNDDIKPSEFYFEYHFFLPYMMKHGWKNRIDWNCSLLCATKKFLLMRKKGIRSHPWV